MLQKLPTDPDTIGLFSRLLEKIKSVSKSVYLICLVVLFSAMISFLVFGCAVLAHKEDGHSSLLILPEKQMDKVLDTLDQPGQQNPESNVEAE